MEQRAIIITYIGEEVTEYILSKMVEAMTAVGITTPEKAHAVLLNNKDILGLIVNKNYEKKETTESPTSRWYPLEQAAEYLSVYYKNHLNDDMMTFSIIVCRDILNGNVPHEYKTAIKILNDSMPLTRVATSILNKYKISSQFAKTLVEVYKNLQ